MSVPFLINKQPMNIASRWEELTLGQTIDILAWANSESKEIVELAAIISGMDKSYLMQQPMSQVSKIAAVGISFIPETPEPDKWQCPYQFELDGKIYNREFDAGDISYGCMSLFEATIMRGDIKFAEKIPIMIASIIYKGSFKGREKEAKKDIEDLANNHVMNMKFTDAHPLASFFLNKCERFLQSQEEILLTAPLKKGRALGSWKSLASSVRRILSRAVIRYNSRQS